MLFVVIGWLANGIAYLIVGLRNKQSASRGFYLFFGTLQVVLALLIIAWPSATVTVLVRVIGIGLLITAAFRVWASNRIRKAGSRRAGRDRQPVAAQTDVIISRWHSRTEPRPAPPGRTRRPPRRS